MKLINPGRILFLLFSIICVTGCQNVKPTVFLAITTPTSSPFVPAEAEVERIFLGEPINKPMAELSGLTWAGNWLILLPQYPAKFDDHIYRIHKDEIMAYLQGNPNSKLTAQEVDFISAGLEKKVTGFEGFESITTRDNNAYLTIESNAKNMTGYLVNGTWNDDFSALTLSADSLTEIPSQENISNSSYESVLIFGKRIVTLYEVNGKNVNSQPQAQLFEPTNAFIQSLNFPNIEYRITDATLPDQNGLFWVINYFYPGDESKLKPADDLLSNQYGQGETHAKSDVVERLVALQFSEDGIVFADQAPIQLALLPDNEARNWEGIVKLEDLGFLLVTDSFPETWLAFVPFTPQK